MSLQRAVRIGLIALLLSAGCSAKRPDTSGPAGGGAGLSGGAANGANGGSGGSDPFATGCAMADVHAGRVTPTVWLVVDGSSSMTTQFGNSDRWQTLREALMDPTAGVVPKLQGGVVFGMVIFSGGQGQIGGGGLFGGGGRMMNADGGMAAGGGTCPALTIVDPALNNFNNMNGKYPNRQPGGTTPTQLALEQISSRVSMPAQMVDKSVNPTYVVLATDGQPNGCDLSMIQMAGGGADPAAESAVYDQVKKIVGTGTKLFAISLAGGDMALQSHLNMVAMLGNTGKAPFTPMNKDDLVSTFQDIIGGAIGCDVHLDGTVQPNQECLGTVSVNGTNLVCNDPNGWHLRDAHTIEITGTACDKFKADVTAQLHAKFPCNAYTPS